MMGVREYAALEERSKGAAIFRIRASVCGKYSKLKSLSAFKG